VCMCVCVCVSCEGVGGKYGCDGVGVHYQMFMSSAHAPLY